MTGIHGNLKAFFDVIIVLCILGISCGEKGPVTIASPDGKILVTITEKGGENARSLMYDVSFNGIPVLTQSPLGVVFKDGVSVAEGLNITAVNLSNADEKYTIPYGKTTEIGNRYNEASLSLEDPGGRKMNLVFRVFDDGAAFRYNFPVQDALKQLEISGEVTAFNFPGDYEYWGLHLDSFTTSYETDYTIATLRNIKPESLVGLPLLVRVSDSSWTALTEANLTDYAGMYLKGVPGKESLLGTALSPLPDSSGVCVREGLPHSSPWRVLMIADNPGRLVESNIILNLNEPCAIDYSWIKPGKTAWDWWSGQVVKGTGFDGKMDNRTMKHYIDFAGDYGLEYMLVDAGWYGRDNEGNADITTSIPDINVPELVEYAQARNVGIILWLNWRCVERQMDDAFSLYEKWGVKGVKVDYMNRDDQVMVNFYHRVVKKAAEHKLIVDFHGAYKPTGFRRTYPNLITREGVMGLEYCKWSNRITPEHDCILPFTRMLAGPMDYTPGGFSNASRETFKSQNKEPMTQGTRCHQLALYVIFESPLQMLVDYPENYRGKTGIEFLRHVPATWDDTKVFEARVGDYVTIARKHKDEWYLGSICDWTPRELDVPLDFLGSGDYMAEIFADGADADKNAESADYREVIVTSRDIMKIRMAPGGGHAVRFYPAPRDTELPRYKP